VGVFGSFWLTRLIGAQLYQVNARDPWTFAFVAVTLSVIGFVATLVPPCALLASIL